MVAELAPHEEVHINVLDEAMAADVGERLRRAGVPMPRVFLHLHPTNDAWCRDHGPMFVQRQGDGGTQQAVVDWGYNAWGGKYPPYDLDDLIPVRVAEAFGLPLFQPGIIMEGGALDVNLQSEFFVDFALEGLREGFAIVDAAARK